MRRVQLTGNGAATASAVANVTIPTAGKIRGAQLYLFVDSTTDNGRVTIEISPIPTSQIAVNGSQEPFISVSWYANVGAAGSDSNGLNVFFPLDVDVRQGEIIYLHANVATASYYANVILFYA